MEERGGEGEAKEELFKKGTNTYVHVCTTAKLPFWKL